MALQSVLTRAKRGMREDVGLYVVAVASLTVAFLGLSGALLGVENLESVRARWGQSHRMSVYLEPQAEASAVTKLRSVLEELESVERVDHLTSAVARERFLNDSSFASDLSGLPPDVFPASLEVRFAPDAAPSRMAEVAQRVAGFGAVQDVDTYAGWFGKLAGLVGVGETLALLMAALVGVCVISVVGNTIRLAVANRRQEIEVLKMCGATDGFVRGPLVLEGALQGFAAAAVSMVLLGVGFALLRGQLDALLVPLAGTRATFLPWWGVLGMLAGGTAAGATGSALSIRRYLRA